MVFILRCPFIETALWGSSHRLHAPANRPAPEPRFHGVIRRLGLAPSSLPMWPLPGLLKGFNALMHGKHVVLCLGQSRSLMNFSDGNACQAARSRGARLRRRGRSDSHRACVSNCSAQRESLAALPLFLLSLSTPLPPSPPALPSSPETSRLKPAFLEGSGLPGQRFCQRDLCRHTRPHTWLDALLSPS